MSCMLAYRLPNLTHYSKKDAHTLHLRSSSRCDARVRAFLTRTLVSSMPANACLRPVMCSFVDTNLTEVTCITHCVHPLRGVAWVAVGGWRGRLSVWTDDSGLETNVSAKAFRGHSADVICLSYDPGTNLLVSGDRCDAAHDVRNAILPHTRTQRC